MTESDVPAGYALLEGYPSVDDYVHLRTASGLTPKNAEQAAAAIKGTWYGVWAAEESDPGAAVAMGRIIGDGGVSCFYIVPSLEGISSSLMGRYCLFRCFVIINFRPRC